MASCNIYNFLPVQVTNIPVLLTVASQHRGVITLGQIFKGEPPPMRLASSPRHDDILHTAREVVFRRWFTGVVGLVQLLVSPGLKFLEK